MVEAALVRLGSAIYSCSISFIRAREIEVHHHFVHPKRELERLQGKNKAGAQICGLSVCGEKVNRKKQYHVHVTSDSAVQIVHEFD